MKQKLQVNILQDLECEIIGQKLCRIDFRKDKSIFLGLGNRIQPRKENTCVSFYGEWELGSYNASWRILYDGKIVMASQSDSLKYKAREIQVDSEFLLLQVQEITPYDIRIRKKRKRKNKAKRGKKKYTRNNLKRKKKIDKKQKEI